MRTVIRHFIPFGWAGDVAELCRPVGQRAVDFERERQRLHPDRNGDDADPDDLAAAALNALDFVITSLPTNGSYYGYVDVPNDATNLNIAVGFSSGKLGIFLTNQEVVNTSDYGTNGVTAPGGSNVLSANAALNLLFDPAVPNAPPLSGGRWYYDITNESTTAR